jgi:hypothetical protein
MKIELDMDELLGAMIEKESLLLAMVELHPEFMGTFDKRLKFLQDIKNAGRTHEVWTQEELEEDRAMQLDASMRRSVNNLIYTRRIK